MWVWYFILVIILLMVIVQYAGSRRKKPFSGIKALLPQFNEEIGEDLTPYYKIKSQLFVEKLTKTPLPYFETTLDLYVENPQILRAEWTIGENFKSYLTQKYGQDIWQKSHPVLRLNYTNAVPQPYSEDIPINLAEKQKTLTIKAPGETLNCQLGIISEKGLFITIAQSNDVTIPQVQ